MKECFQFESMNMLDHGESVRDWYLDLKRRILSDPGLKYESSYEWHLPSWIDSPLIKEHFLTADDETVRLYQIYHDCGKPQARTVIDGKQHFPNHAAVSKQRWLDCGGSQEVADLIGMDMDVHTLRSDGVEAFAARPQALTLLLTGLCEIHSNAQMFGGIESTSFKMKWKNIERFGKRIVDILTNQKLWHYVIVRADLPIGSKLAMVVHAAGESADPKPEPGTSAVVLHAVDEKHLKIIQGRLDKAGLRYHCVYEGDDDPKFPGQFMSIGLVPVADKGAVKKVLSSLPLAK